MKIQISFSPSLLRLMPGKYIVLERDTLESEQVVLILHNRECNFSFYQVSVLFRDVLRRTLGKTEPWAGDTNLSQSSCFA